MIGDRHFLAAVSSTSERRWQDRTAQDIATVWREKRRLARGVDAVRAERAGAANHGGRRLFAHTLSRRSQNGFANYADAISHAKAICD
jgi:hypothetical protein